MKQIKGEFQLRLICSRCGGTSFWPVNVTETPNMPTCCNRDLLILGNSKVFMPYISEDHPFMKPYLRKINDK